MRYSVILLTLISGCGSMLTTTDQAQTYARNALVGRDASAFFSTHGLPVGKLETAEGAIYEWRSGVRSHQQPMTTTVVSSGVRTSATTTGGGSVALYCQATVTVDKAGRITDFRITRDTVGDWSLSRCAEVLR